MTRHAYVPLACVVLLGFPSMLSSSAGWAQDVPTSKLVARDGKRVYRPSLTAVWFGRIGISRQLGAGVLLAAARR